MPNNLQTIKVLGIGEVVSDTIVMVEDLVSEIPVQGTKPTQDVGGSILSALVVLARLGIDCTMMTSVGDDAEGHKITSILSDEGIKLINFPQNSTKKNLVLVHQTDGSRLKKKGDVVHQPLSNLDPNFLRDYAYVLIDRHQPRAFYEILTRKSPATKIIIDPSTEVSELTLDMMQFSEYPVVPIETLERLTTLSGSPQSLSWLYQLCQKPILVTAGEAGSFIFDGQKIQHVPSFSFPVTDVTGAGDTFRGAFVFGLIQNWSLEKAASFGNYVAALQCRTIGNVGAIATTEELAAFGQLVSLNKPELDTSIINHKSRIDMYVS